MELEVIMIKKLFLAIRTSNKLGKVSGLINKGHFERAYLELDKVSPAAKGSMKFLMLKGSCLIGLHKFREANEVYLAAKKSVEMSNFRATDKEYLYLYADYMRGYIRDKSGSGAHLNNIRNRAANIKADVTPRYTWDFPMD